jgi:hypothetical protein
MPEENAQEIVVVARRRQRSGDRPQPTISLSISTSGGDFNDIFPELVRGIFINETDFDIQPDLTAKEKEIIVKAIRGIAAHPKYANAFAALATKGADINIRLVNSASDLHTDAQGYITGLSSDNTVSQGASLTIWLRRSFQGDTVTPFQFAVTTVHELIHALGVPALTAELDVPYNDIDRLLTIEIFRGYDWMAPAAAGPLSNLIRGAESGGTLIGSADFDVFSGSNQADTIVPAAGGSLVYSGAGDDNIQIVLGNGVDVVRDEGGQDRITMPNGLAASRITTRWSDDGVDLTVLVDGVPEATIENAAGSGAVEIIDVAGSTIGIASFSTSIDLPISDGTRQVDYFGAFSGGYLGSTAATDPEGAPVTYRLASVEGAYADQEWSVDPNSGAVHANFVKPDQPGSEFTFVDVLATDGMSDACVRLTVRWARAGEQFPEL